MSTKYYQTLEGQITIAFFSIIFIALLYRAFIWSPTFAKPRNEGECIGKPIYVNYPFQSEYLEPHECKRQCGKETQFYIYYNDGKATQCDTPPSCLDYGEDNGITCDPREQDQHPDRK